MRFVQTDDEEVNSVIPTPCKKIAPAPIMYKNIEYSEYLNSVANTDTVPCWEEIQPHKSSEFGNVRAVNQAQNDMCEQYDTRPVLPVCTVDTDFMSTMNMADNSVAVKLISVGNVSVADTCAALDTADEYKVQTDLEHAEEDQENESLLSHYQILDNVSGSDVESTSSQDSQPPTSSSSSTASLLPSSSEHCSPAARKDATSTELTPSTSSARQSVNSDEKPVMIGSPGIIPFDSSFVQDVNRHLSNSCRKRMAAVECTPSSTRQFIEIDKGPVMIARASAVPVSASVEKSHSKCVSDGVSKRDATSEPITCISSAKKFVDRGKKPAVTTGSKQPACLVSNSVIRLPSDNCRRMNVVQDQQQVDVSTRRLKSNIDVHQRAVGKSQNVIQLNNPKQSVNASKSKTPEQSTGSHHQPVTSQGCFEANVMKILLKLNLDVKEINDRLTHLSALVREIHPAVTEADLELPDGIQLPMSTTVEMESMDEALVSLDLRKRLVAQLSLIGGRHLSDVVGAQLKFLMTKQLQRLYNWCGQKSKLSFGKLQLARVMCKAIRKNHQFSQVTDREVRDACARCFTNARDRSKQNSSRTNPSELPLEYDSDESADD